MSNKRRYSNNLKKIKNIKKRGGSENDSNIIDLSCEEKYCNQQQPIELFNKNDTVETAVKDLLFMTHISQQKLEDMMNDYVTTSNNTSIFYSPGIKTEESAIRKVNTMNKQIRRLTDVYRGSIVLNDLKEIDTIDNKLNELFIKYKFKNVYFRDAFKKPWKDGYRDMNYKLADIENHNLVGELQIQYCPIKKFTEIVGHKSYEILRNMEKGKEKDLVEENLNELTNYGYNNVFKNSDENCLNSLKSMENNKVGGTRKQQLTKRHRRSKHKKTKKRSRKTRRKHKRKI
jgi:hypothetical protein